MTTLTDYDFTDMVDDHEAADVNELHGGVLYAKYVNTQSISATKELADNDCPMQIITPTSADRTVELPPEATTNHFFFIKNPTGSTYDVVVKDDSGATTYCTLDANQWALCIPAGSAWHVIPWETRLAAIETYGSAVLGSTYSISASAGTYADTGLSVTLPMAGTYEVIANVRCTMVPNTGTGWYIEAKLYNSTDAADVANSERMVARESVVELLDLSASIYMIVTVTDSKVIKLYAKRDGAGTPTFTTSDISSDGSGRTTLAYRRIL